MLVREMGRPSSVVRKEMLFKRRGKEFLIMSFAIAGGGAILLSIFFTLFLSRPLKKMRDAVVTMAHRDFSVRLPVVSRDEMGSLSESFNFMAEALEREEALRKHLTSNIAHELRTPLSIMKANVEAMLDGVIEDKITGLKNIQAEVEKLVRLVQGIEDITKAEASFFARKDYKPLELREFLANIVQKIKPLASAKGLEMIITEAKDLSVYADSDKLERVLQNILSNAIRHTQKGSITIDYWANGDTFFIRVSDTGTGIEGNILELIFRRFYHGVDSTGLGLGLSIVKELLEVMGGSIDVESRKGEGSTFTIQLPIKQ
jgi:two-component system sensor histidine kinase BaeS